MTRYILQRLALLPLLMVIYSFVIFVIIQAPPGDFLTPFRLLGFAEVVSGHPYGH